MNRGEDKAIAAQAEQIYVYERFPHHLNPVKMWNDGFVVPFLWHGRCLVAALGDRLRRPAGTACGFHRRCIVLTLIGAASDCWAFRIGQLPRGWLHYYWFRLADVRCRWDCRC